jgi:hypothetical protein
MCRFRCCRVGSHSHLDAFLNDSQVPSTSDLIPYRVPRAQMVIAKLVYGIYMPSSPFSTHSVLMPHSNSLDEHQIFILNNNSLNEQFMLPMRSWPSRAVTLYSSPLDTRALSSITKICLFSCSRPPSLAVHKYEDGLLFRFKQCFRMYTQLQVITFNHLMQKGFTVRGLHIHSLFQ